MADLNIGNSSASVVVNAKHNGSVIPQINNTYDLGTSALKWKNIYGDLKGNADTTTKFASAQSITLTGDVTGTASSQAGWSITTTLSNSGVTNGTYGPTGNIPVPEAHTQSAAMRC